MADIEKKNMQDPEEKEVQDIDMNQDEDFDEPIVLVDEETGEEKAFDVIARDVVDGQLYYALVPADDEEAEEYYLLKATIDGDDILFETVDDDEEFDKVEDYFNDLFFNEIDYDEN